MITRIGYLFINAHAEPLILLVMNTMKRRSVKVANKKTVVVLLALLD
jgi:hypothetical protein